jgi:HEAT repeat protein
MMSAVFWGSIGVAVAMLLAVIIERATVGISQLRWAHLERRYMPLLRRALAGDDDTIDRLAESPAQHRLTIGYLLIGPLIEDRDPVRIEATRRVARGIFVVSLAEGYLRSWRWWRRALGLRGLGLIRDRDHTGAIVGALDDPHPDVRAAALDALTDLRDPAALPAILVRLLDASLQPGRRAAALDAFGMEAEPFVLALAEIDADHRVDYARALAICGTARARPVLRRWTLDDRAEVRTGALSALARVGLDEDSALAALASLESDDAHVRAAAARAFHGWRGSVDASEPLERHLDDAWTVAVPAARSLQSMGGGGLARLTAKAAHPGLAGLLARQMIWETQSGIAS